MKISLNWLKRYVDVPCSAKELGHKLTMVGFPVPSIEAVGDDFLLDVEVTSNRPDLLSHLGMAREVAGILDSGRHLVETATPTSPDDVIGVEVTAPDLCPRYTACVVRGVKVGPSPAWLVKLLETVGQRSVNNVVDVTNFVMLECGQPLHAFDLAKLRGPRIVVRRAEGESMTAIDGTKLVVGKDELAICDAERPIALAGVMGGLDTEVSTTTRDVVLETAFFAPLAIRATSRAHQMKSEASFRFERFVDPEGVNWAANRAVRMFAEICGATGGGPIQSAGSPTRGSRTVRLRNERIQRVFGIAVAESAARTILQSLGFEPCSETDPATTSWIVPSWRPDVTSEIDLIEEVARCTGFDRVPADVRIPVRPAPRDDRRRALRRLRDALVGAGLRECCTAPFVGEGPNDISLVRDVPALRVENPMRSEENLLRRSLLGPLLVVARGNRDRGVAAVRLFEVAPVYLRGEKPKTDEEVLLASGVVTGPYADAKGCVEAVLEAMGVAGVAAFALGAPAPLRRDRSATVRVGEDVIGYVGELSVRSLAKFGLEAGTSVFELRADRLAALAQLETKYKPVPRFPAVERDLAWVVDESVSWASIESAARGAAGEMLASIRPFDVFRGAQIGAGKKSVALRMELRAADRTLKTAEADACVAGVLDALARATRGTLRS
jgi:phenylalanyl-tRNA synthetase beta chain